MPEFFRRRRRDVLLMVVGAMAAAVLITPAGAHVGGTVGHLWKQHLLPLAKKSFYTKSASDARYLGKNAKAADANQLDGKDSNAFLLRPTGPGVYSVSGATWIDEDSANHDVPIANVGLFNSTWCTQSGGRAHQQVFLPQGSTVTGLHAQYLDDDVLGTSNGTLFLVRSDIMGTGGTYADVATAILPNDAISEVSTSSGTLSSTPEELVVDNTKYTYILIAAMNGTSAICTTQVTYSQPGAPTTGVPSS